MRLIKEAGGLALVQDPDDAMYEAMPRAAIAYAHPHATVSARVLGRMISEVAGTYAEQEEEAMAGVGPVNAPDPVAEQSSQVEKTGREG